MTGTLYIIATPIGNLQDMSPRALTTLREAGLILAEDTRVVKKLLSHFKSVKNVKEAPETELVEVIGKAKGKLVFDFYNKPSTEIENPPAES